MKINLYHIAALNAKWKKFCLARKLIKEGAQVILDPVKYRMLIDIFPVSDF